MLLQIRLALKFSLDSYNALLRPLRRISEQLRIPTHNSRVTFRQSHLIRNMWSKRVLQAESKLVLRKITSAEATYRAM